MNRHNPIEYLTECTLATVEYMAGTKRISKHEYNRQISIAQFGIDSLLVTDYSKVGGRCAKILNGSKSVRMHADAIRQRWFQSCASESNPSDQRAGARGAQ